MLAKKLFELPVPGSGCGETQIVTDGVECVIRYEFHKDGKDWIGAIKFIGLVAHRFRNEYHSAGYAGEAYDSVAEILDSTWLKELVKLEPAGVRGASGKHHFAVFLSSNGYFEIIADAFETLPAKEGLLST